MIRRLIFCLSLVLPIWAWSAKLFGLASSLLTTRLGMVFFFLPENLVKKALYVGLKLLPSLIRCLLSHETIIPPFLNEDDGHFRRNRVPGISGPLSSPEKSGRDFCNVFALEARCSELVFARQPFSVTPGDRRRSVGRPPRDLVDPHLPRKSIGKADD